MDSTSSASKKSKRTLYSKKDIEKLNFYYAEYNEYLPTDKMEEIAKELGYPESKIKVGWFMYSSPTLQNNHNSELKK